jgi:aspartate/methionine/tyrosine aminotransferase
MISKKAAGIDESRTIKIFAKARAMKAEGIDVIDMSAGEPDFPTPENIKAAGIEAIRRNFTKYTENDGIPALREAIIRRLQEDHGVTYALNEVIVSAGAKNSLFHAIQAIVGKGDEVIIPSPYWVTYPECVKLADGKPVILEAREEDGFLLTPERLEAAITPATRALILNNPCNPTGAAYDRARLEALAGVLRGRDITVISDEIYGKLVYDGFRFTSFASLGEDIRRQTVIINGVSKAYAMTGWRVGFAAGPHDIIQAMSRIQSHTISCVCSIAQKASQEAFAGPQDEVGRMVREFGRRRTFAMEKLREAPGLTCFRPLGAFYVFPNVTGAFGRKAGGADIRDSEGMAEYLLEKARVAVVPGDAFGAEGFIRISYATSMENLSTGLSRIIDALK